MNTQQKEALGYFGEYAQDWKRKAGIATADKVNTIKQRNDFVVQVVSDRGNIGRVLDVGCGTGDLVCELAAKGLEAVGVDFAQEMIDIAVENAKKSNLEKAKFECSSIFDYRLEPGAYDVLAANGFIEYISYEELDRFLELSLQTLKPGGSLVVGSRNRLFNIFSLNAFTEQEIAEDALALLSEAVKVANAESIKDLIGLKTASLQKEEKVHPLTGVKVSTRYQFTPVQLIDIFINKGFEPVEIFPVHIHGVPPKFKTEFPAIHGNISNLLQTQARGHMSLIPQASSFMLHAKKK